MLLWNIMKIWRIILVMQNYNIYAYGLITAWGKKIEDIFIATLPPPPPSGNFGITARLK